MIDFKEEVLKHKDEMLKDLKDLCLIPSTLDKSTAKENQPFGENNRKALDLMLSIGQRDGFVTDDCDGYAGSIDIGEGEECFGILGHLDVVPTEGQEWDYPEYDMTLDGDTLYGRGVADDKGPLIAAYYAAKIVNELDFEKKMKVRIIFGCNEENGSRCMHYYFQHRPYPKMGFTPDADFPVVYGEKGNCHFIIKGKTDDDKVISIHSGRVVNIVPDQAKAVLKGTDYEESYNAFLKENNFKGSLEVVDGNTHLFLKGKSAHASHPHLGNNAASNLCHYIASVTDNSYAKFVDEYLYNDYLGEKFNVAFTGEMGALTVNLGILNYENNEGSLTLDLRLPHDSDNDELVKNVDEAVNKYGLNEEHDIGPALYVDPNSELVQKLHESYVQFTNDHEHGPQTIGGGTYAKEMPNCVAFGCEFPGKNHHMHEENELISLDDLLTAAAIYAQSLYNLLKK